MRKMLSALLTAFILLSFSACSGDNTLEDAERLAIFETVNGYYYDLGTENFESALSKVLLPTEKKDSAGFEMNSKAYALSTLSESAGYSIRLAEIPSEVYYYMSENDIYIVSVYIDIEIGGETRRAEEILHMVKPLREWKIDEIESADPFVPLRSNKYWYYTE